MIKKYNSLGSLVDSYSENERTKVHAVLKGSNNFGLQLYGIMAIGLGNELKELTKFDVRSFYNHPSWEPNSVDILIARVVCTLEDCSCGRDLRKRFKKSYEYGIKGQIDCLTPFIKEFREKKEPRKG